VLPWTAWRLPVNGLGDGPPTISEMRGGSFFLPGNDSLYASIHAFRGSKEKGGEYKGWDSRSSLGRGLDDGRRWQFEGAYQWCSHLTNASEAALATASLPLFGSFTLTGEFDFQLGVSF